MRSFILLCILSCAASQSDTERMQCAVDSGEAISDAMDAVLFMFAASKRCGKQGMQIKCEVDVTEAIKSVNSVANVILKSVDKCGGLQIANKKCGMAAGVVSKHAAGLAAASGDLAQKCPSIVGAPAPAAMGALAAPVMCTIDLKNTLKNLFKGVREVMKIKSNCENSESKLCAINSLQLASSFVGMGEYLAAAVGHCTRTTLLSGNQGSTNTRGSLCAAASLSLINHAADVTSASLALSRACEESAPLAARLYTQYSSDEVDEADEPAPAVSPSLLLGACLPIAGIVGFAAGRSFGKSRASSRDLLDSMSDNECE